MCIQLIEVYSVCGCVYYKHAVDRCANYRSRGHHVAVKEVKVGYACSRHTTGAESLHASEASESRGRIAIRQELSHPRRWSSESRSKSPVPLQSLTSPPLTPSVFRQPSPTQQLSSAQQPTTSGENRQTKHNDKIRPCYAILLVALSFIIGSLTPAIWWSAVVKDISSAFSIAQYILGVGMFVVGSMIALHAKRCVCWQKRHCFSLCIA